MATRIKHYEIEGELLTKEQIVARSGQKEVTITYRLGKGNRTWANLSKPAGQAQRESRARLQTSVGKSAELRRKAKP